METRNAPDQSRGNTGMRFFYVGMAIVFGLVVFIGFSRTYYLKGLFGRPPLPLLAHLHGALFTSWIALFLVQALLVERNRTDLHRRLGLAGAVLALLMICAGTAMGINAARYSVLSSPGSARPLTSLAIPIFDMVVFSILVAAAFYYRRNPQTHKRLMLVATITLLPAAIGRFPLDFIARHGALAFFGLADLLLLSCIIYDTVVHRRLHPAYLWAGILLVSSHPLRLVLGETGAWIAFAHWLTRV